MYEQERYEEALPAFEAALALAERSLGIGDDRSLDIVDDIANVLWDLDRQSEGFALRQRILAAVEEERGSKHSALIRPLTDLGWHYEDEEWQTKGDPLFRRALEIALNTYNANSLKFADVLL